MDLFISTLIGLSLTLGISALGGLFSERSGVINIGIEGMMTSGGLIWAICGAGFGTSNLSQIAAFMLSAIVGALIAMLHGFVCISLRGNQIISGTAINMLTVGFALFVINAFNIGDIPGQIASNFRVIGFLNEGFWSQISILLVFIIIIFIVAWWVLKKTKWGLHLRTVGENPIAAESMGINVVTKRYQALIISGLLAGFGGGLFVQYSGGTFYGGVQGMGFLALGILIFGQWRVHYVGIATIIFASFTSFALIGQVQFNISWLNKVPKEFMQTVPFIASIIIMILTAKTMSSPRALGRPYKKSKI